MVGLGGLDGWIQSPVMNERRVVDPCHCHDMNAVYDKDAHELE